jgi:hypothetical protein
MDTRLPVTEVISDLLHSERRFLIDCYWVRVRGHMFKGIDVEVWKDPETEQLSPLSQAVQIQKDRIGYPKGVRSDDG